MRIRAALVLAAAAAAVALPAQTASAVCIPAYELVTGKCSPCNSVNDVSRTLHDKYGIPPVVQTNCLA